MQSLKISNNGVSLIKHFESLHDGDLSKIGLQPKPDPIGIITAGYGHALTDLDGSFLKGPSGYRRMLELYPELETITEEEACELLASDLGKYEDQVNLLKLDLKQYQFDSLVSFVFNCGIGNLKSSTLLRRIKGEPGPIVDAFLMWNKSGGKVLNGLTKRRMAEAVLFTENKLIF